jgi:hypothetical protein
VAYEPQEKLREALQFLQKMEQLKMEEWFRHRYQQGGHVVAAQIETAEMWTWTTIGDWCPHSPETSRRLKLITLVFHSNVVTLAGVAQWQSSGVPRWRQRFEFLSPAPFLIKECLAPHEALGRLAGVVDITTTLLVVLGLVLVTTIVLSATALASVLIVGGLHWMVLAAGLWLLLLSWIVAIGYRGRRR